MFCVISVPFVIITNLKWPHLTVLRQLLLLKLLKHALPCGGGAGEETEDDGSPHGHHYGGAFTHWQHHQPHHLDHHSPKIVVSRQSHLQLLLHRFIWKLLREQFIEIEKPLMKETPQVHLIVSANPLWSEKQKGLIGKFSIMERFSGHKYLEKVPEQSGQLMTCPWGSLLRLSGRFSEHCDQKTCLTANTDNVRRKSFCFITLFNCLR